MPYVGEWGEDKQMRGCQHIEAVSWPCSFYCLLHNSDDKDYQKGVRFWNATDISCVIGAKKFKTEKNFKTHDLKYHMKKAIINGYSCDYCRRSFSAKKDLLGHITNQYKKCDICQKQFQSEKVLEAHKRSVHKQVQVKHTIEGEPSFKNHKNRKKKLRKWLNIKGQIVMLVKVQQNLRKTFKLNKDLKGNLRWDSVYLLIHWS